jgi:hypothetical protein
MVSGDELGNFRQRLLAKLVANLREGLAFGIRQLCTTADPDAGLEW